MRLRSVAHYDREIDDYRTIEVNEILSAIGSFSIDSGNKKGGQSRKILDLSALVPKAGVEPARPKAHDFESSASTNSATQAFDERASTLLANGLQICVIFLRDATG